MNHQFIKNWYLTPMERSTIMPSFVDSPNGIFPSVCSLDCPDQCGLLLHKKNGKIIKVDGDPNHPVTKGFICNKVRKKYD
jgi:anaerobic selenocysteine-containing dehydrogenase